MKIKTALISIVVSASLIAGGAYGARYAMNSRKKPVEVVPVSNVNTGYWGMTNSLYGVITSQVAQRVVLNEEYPIADIYVEAGQYVEEGTPLFSYDMTLPELELELEELSLLSLELTMKRLEKDLQKLQRTSGSASLYGNDSILTASSMEEEIIAETMPEIQTDTEAAEDTAEEQQSSVKNEETDAAVVVEDIELAEDPELLVSVQESAGSFEHLVKTIDMLFQLYGEELRSDDIAESIRAAVEYNRKHLSEKKVTQVQEPDGTVKDMVSYEILDAVKKELTEEELEDLQECIDLLDQYQAYYVEMMLEEAEVLQGEERTNAVTAIQQEYDRLSTEMQEKPGLLSMVEMLTEQESETETESESESETAGETETGSESESESETATEPETETESENESETAGETESETESESESETAGETETGSESENESETAGESETGPESESESETETEKSEIETEFETESELETEAPLDWNVYINNFRDMSDAVLREEAAAAETYLTQLGTAVSFYQEWLAQPREDIPETYTVQSTMESYALKESVCAFLRAAGEEHLIPEMEKSYKEICFRYVRESIQKLDPTALIREAYEDVRERYDTIGPVWQTELEALWMAEQEASQGHVEIEDTESLSDEMSEAYTPEITLLTLGQILDAYEVILLIQELDPAGDEITLILALEEARDAYMELVYSQKLLVWNYSILDELLKQYGLEIPETEYESEFDDFEDDWGGDWGGFGDDYSYTAEELASMITDKKQEIKDCELDIRENEIAVRAKERIVEKKVVKSTLSGTVVSIGSEDGSSDGEYFAIITNATGLYAKGCISELAMETIKVGDTISGMSYDTGMSFTAVIKEIDDYPDPDGNNMSYGAENPNASYYPFYALIDNPEDVEEGDVEIQLSDSMTNMYDAIYLENYFVRTGNDGKPYVFIQGEDGKLKKQQVVTGRRVSGYAVEIVSGISRDDLIAFPYGKDVVEGAATKVVDMLEDAYM